MKKVFIIFAILSFTLISCASKDVVDESLTEQNSQNTQEINDLETDNTLKQEISSEKTLEAQELTEQNSENNSLKPEDDIELAEQSSEITNPLESLLNDILPEIQEPEVTTLEYEEYNALTVEEITEEQITEDLNIPPQEEPAASDFLTSSESNEAENIIETKTKENQQESAINSNEKTESAISETQPDKDKTVLAVNSQELTSALNQTPESNQNNESEVNLIDSDIQNETETLDSSNQEENIKEILPSRTVTLKKYEYLDITYPGSGWIYMGLTDDSKDLTYFGRKLGTKDTTFSVQAKVEGTKILHFYKNDSLTNNFIDDYLEVVVLNEKGSNKNRIKAPEYKVPVENLQSKNINKDNGNTENSNIENEVKANKETKNQISPDSDGHNDNNVKTSTNIKNNVSKDSKNSSNNESVSNVKNQNSTETTDDNASNDNVINQDFDENEALEQIKQFINEKSYKNALEKLNIYFQNAKNKKDEALYLQGQVYETKSEVQNINKAIESYTALIKNYPASLFWDNANKRVIYLKRFYLEGR